MREFEENFLSTFNECYPFERYILKTPKNLGMIFDDMTLTEIFVPYTEIKPILNDNGSFSRYTEINLNEVHVKVKGNAGEMRIAFIDFARNIREDIIDMFITDFGQYNYESLYVDHEDDDGSDLKAKLSEQKKLIMDKYGECSVKKALRDNMV